MIKKKKNAKQKDNDYILSDGSLGRSDYGTEDYCDFLSSGFTDNEKVEAQEYFEAYLDPQ